MTIDPNAAHVALLEAGFVSASRKGIYLVKKDQEISPAFIPNMIRSKGKIRFGGGAGLHFEEFEIGWRNALSKEEKQIDRTLPLVISIENFLDLNESGVFRLIDKEDDIRRSAEIIFDLCSSLPKSWEELSYALGVCSLNNKKLSQYVHFYSDVDESNIYFSKSSSLFFWVKKKYPVIGDELFACIDERTKILMSRLNRNI